MKLTCAKKSKKVGYTHTQCTHTHTQHDFLSFSSIFTGYTDNLGFRPEPSEVLPGFTSITLGIHMILCMCVLQRGNCWQWTCFLVSISCLSSLAYSYVHLLFMVKTNSSKSLGSTVFLQMMVSAKNTCSLWTQMFSSAVLWRILGAAWFMLLRSWPRIVPKIV